ncbi:MAG: hypothetical protein H8E79_02175 [Desulfobulbaceae bacterium]|uniref:Uncharacterized protein n=1 Tax=Candidatus Desulfatifera sulfidica TaxID=2841691 RepID=A0A8J6N762_9BACT|nr:hypothetical protein [Candidatus Desulfatifera sulfidica]
MKTPTDLWEEIGSLTEEDTLQLVTTLVATYDQRLEREPNDLAARDFFKTLESSLVQTNACNLNRR